MEQYNYRMAVKDSVKDYLNEHGITSVKESEYDEVYQSLYDEMFVSDSVTGNGSGSFTFNAWYAEEYICHNMDLLAEAFEAFGEEPTMETLASAEACDVTIRCYLLSEILTECLEEIQEEDECE